MTTQCDIHFFSVCKAFKKYIYLRSVARTTLSDKISIREQNVLLGDCTHRVVVKDAHKVVWKHVAEED